MSKKFNVINTAVSVVGFGTTIALVVNETPGFMEAKSKLEKQDFANVSKLVFKHYYPAMITGGLTVGSMVAGGIVNNKTQGSLIAATGAAYGLYKRFGDQVCDKLGLEKYKGILKHLANGDISKLDPTKIKVPDGYKLYWEESIGHFLCKPENLQKARYEINKSLLVKYGDDARPVWFISIQTFLDMCEASQYEKDAAFEFVGWDLDDLSDNYDSSSVPWIDIEIGEECEGNNGLKYTMVYFVSQMRAVDTDDAIIQDKAINLLEAEAKERG